MITVYALLAGLAVVVLAIGIQLARLPKIEGRIDALELRNERDDKAAETDRKSKENEAIDEATRILAERKHTWTDKYGVKRVL